MALNESDFKLKIASSQEEILSSQRLRFKVFVEELGAQSNADNHDLKIETDEYDKWFEHLILIDKSIDPATMNHVVGVYRLLRGDIALDKCGFYSDAEFDLTPLLNSGRKLLELGRSCVHPDYRSGIAMYLLWNRLAQYV
ncbi:MAG: GNAT family N-acetyltransferase, partial [Rhodobacteraceae bacterium]|nr:GNAT family N-acetyltransferase [Paracoccaceae bacterium]